MEVQYGLFSLIFLDVLFYLGKHVPPVLAYSLPVTGKMFSVASDYQVLCVFISFSAHTTYTSPKTEKIIGFLRF